MRKEAEFFNETSENYLAEYQKITPEGYSFRVRREKTISLIPDGGERSALDIGCGPGVMIKALLEKNYKNIECVDAAPEMIKIIEKKYGANPNIKAATGDVMALDSNDNSFDLVLAMGLLEYLDDQDTPIKEICRVLKNSGTAFITFPNKKSSWRIWNRSMIAIFGSIIKIIKSAFGKKTHPLKHKEYTKKEASLLLKKNGLIAEKIIFYNFKLIPHPFDKIFPRLTVWQSKLLEKLDKTFLRFIGTGFIIQARKNV